MLRIDQVPKIEVHVIKSGEPPGGIGETGVTAGPPALRNAIYAATGVALAVADRSLSLRREEIMNAAARSILLSVVVVVVVALAAGLWIIRGPGPMAFADGAKVALADYEAADPTGAPASLAKTTPVERGGSSWSCTAPRSSKSNRPPQASSHLKKWAASSIGVRLRVNRS